MTVWFISRHLGAIEWMKKQDLAIDAWATHLDILAVKPGDIVVGVLPLMVAAEVCRKGARFLALVLPQAASARGQEHSYEAMLEMGAYLQEYIVQGVPIGAN